MRLTRRGVLCRLCNDTVPLTGTLAIWLEGAGARQDTPKRELVEQLQHRQNLVELQRRVRLLHQADLAFVLQSLPRDDRLLIWHEVDSRQAAETLIEMEPAAGKLLVEATPRKRLKEIVSELDLDDLASLSDILPEETLQNVGQSLGVGERSLFRETISYPKDSVGELMTRDLAAVRESQTVADVLADLRLRQELPTPLDRLFVVDPRNLLRAQGASVLLTFVTDSMGFFLFLGLARIFL